MDDEVNEDRIEGMETVLEEFQKTLKQIRRKIRKLSLQCQNQNKKNSTLVHSHQRHHLQCNDNGHKRLNGETWSRDSCTQCMCQVRHLDNYAGAIFFHFPCGWVLFYKRRVTFFLQEKQITCTKVLCPTVACPKPEIKSGECCPVCPTEKKL